jgi:uncharacterized protein YjiS (DUF1127 family)
VRGRQRAAPVNKQQESIMIITHIISRIRAYMRYRQSVRALQTLSDRELADIGMVRGDIEARAKDAVMA